MTTQTTTSSVTSRDGTTIAYEKSGSGPALVLVGGALSNRSHPTVREYAAVLSQHFTVYNFDRRGRGDSGDTPPYTPEREVEDLAAVIDAAGGSALVYGHSSGAALAIATAARVPTSIARLALYEPPFIVDDGRPAIPEDFVPHLEALLSDGRRGDAVEYFLVQGVGMPVEYVASLRNTPPWPGMEALAHTLPYDGAVVGDNMRGHPLDAERWQAATMPALVVAGGGSPAWMLRSAQAAADALPNATFRTLDEQGHGAAPDVLVPVLVEFLQ
jgi:pimeloyl-ACP methyl ester carboxylesterase